MDGSRCEPGVRDVSGLGAHARRRLCLNRQISQTQGVSLVPPRPVLCDESSKRVQGGEPICIVFIPLSAEPAKRAKSFVFRFESSLAHSESARRKTGTFRLALSPVHRRVQKLCDSLPTSPVFGTQSQSAYSEIIPIVLSHVSTN